MIETFEGPGKEGSYFTGQNNSIFSTLNNIFSEDASLSVHGSTIAAHSDHIRYYLLVIRAMVKGRDFEKNWGISWGITHVDEMKWMEIREGLTDEYTKLLEEIDTVDLEEWGTNVFGAVAHSAYHLGAVRQMVKAIKDN